MRTHKVTTVHGETFVLIADKIVCWEIRHAAIIVHFVNGDTVSLHKTEEDSFLRWMFDVKPAAIAENWYA